MFQINLPPFDTNIQMRQGKPRIFDVLRRRFVAVTPEEWVRQHFIHYLIDHKGYPQALLANEISLTLNGMWRRCDSVLYTMELTPRMIIEYKAPHVALTQKVFDQISVYNLLLKVDYLIVSNGMEHICCKMDYEHQKYLFLQDVPDYENL